MQNQRFTKSYLRKIFLQKRLELTPEKVLELSSQINQNFIKNTKHFLPSLENKVIALYQPIKNEVVLNELKEYLLYKGTRIALPKVLARDRYLDFILFSSQKLLLNKSLSILEPEGGDVVIPDLVVVPLVAFDKNLTRIGMGGGFYDRTIEFLRKNSKNIVFVGVAYDLQYCEHSIDREQFDQSLDFVVSQKDLFFTK